MSYKMSNLKMDPSVVICGHDIYIIVTLCTNIAVYQMYTNDMTGGVMSLVYIIMIQPYVSLCYFDNTSFRIWM